MPVSIGQKLAAFMAGAARGQQDLAARKEASDIAKLRTRMLQDDLTLRQKKFELETKTAAAKLQQEAQAEARIQELHEFGLKQQQKIADRLEKQGQAPSGGGKASVGDISLDRISMNAKGQFTTQFDVLTPSEVKKQERSAATDQRAKGTAQRAKQNAKLAILKAARIEVGSGFKGPLGQFDLRSLGKTTVDRLKNFQAMVERRAKEMEKFLESGKMTGDEMRRQVAETVSENAWEQVEKLNAAGKQLTAEEFKQLLIRNGAGTISEEEIRVQVEVYANMLAQIAKDRVKQGGGGGVLEWLFR